MSILFEKKTKKKCIFIFSKNYFYNFFTNLNYYYDKSTNRLIFQSNKYSPKVALFDLYINNFVKSLVAYTLLKLKFAGKSFKVEKFKYDLIDFPEITTTRNHELELDVDVENTDTALIYTYKFGKSFKTNIFLKNIKFKQLKKTKLFFVYTDVFQLKQTLIKIKLLRP